MSDLMISVYRSRTAAYAAGEQLAALQRSAGTEPEDIVVISRSAEGRLSVDQSIDMATGAPLGGGGWGVLIGMMFLDPRKPQAHGKGLASQFLATGLDQAFLQAAIHALEDGGAAVGMRLRFLGKEKVVGVLDRLPGKPQIHWTRLGPDTEDALIEMIGQIPQAALGQPSAPRAR